MRDSKRSCSPLPRDVIFEAALQCPANARAPLLEGRKVRCLGAAGPGQLAVAHFGGEIQGGPADRFDGQLRVLGREARARAGLGGEGCTLSEGGALGTGQLDQTLDACGPRAARIAAGEAQPGPQVRIYFAIIPYEFIVLPGKHSN